MTREHAKELLPIITAFANGEEIQYKDNHYEKWETRTNLDFVRDQSRYRIKPKPREWFAFRANGEYWEIQSEAPSAKWDEVIKVREIID